MKVFRALNNDYFSTRCIVARRRLWFRNFTSIMYCHNILNVDPRFSWYLYSGRNEKIGTGDRQDPSRREVGSEEVWNKWSLGRHQKAG